MEKIFIIGRRRTGVGSIVKSFKVLKYKASEIFVDEKASKIDDIIKSMKDKAICGVPFDYTMNDIRAIEAAYPSARFILTERSVDEWYSSFLRFYNGDEARSAYKNKGHYVNDFYVKFNEDVRSYFMGKEWKILYIKFGVNASWASVCSFVKKPTPNKPFPHENIFKK
jgi:hypothetical protein